MPKDCESIQIAAASRLIEKAAAPPVFENSEVTAGCQVAPLPAQMSGESRQAARPAGLGMSAASAGEKAGCRSDQADPSVQSCRDFSAVLPGGVPPPDSPPTSPSAASRPPAFPPAPAPAAAAPDIRSVWDQLDDGMAGSGVDMVIANDVCKVMKTANESGEGLMTIYRAFDGVYIMFNDFHMENCFSQFESRVDVLVVDHCREGSLEMTSGDACCCLDRGEMRIDTRVHHRGPVRFPLCHYHGVTIAFQLGVAEAAIRREMPAFDVDLRALADRFCRDGRPYTVAADPTVDNLFAQLYMLPRQLRTEYFKLKALELLVYLKGLEPVAGGARKPYFYRSQVEKIHGIHDLLVGDLCTDHTQAELAERFEIGLTQMKQCFKAVYGQSIHSYVTGRRMERAAELLLTERGMKVTAIAAQCGYENAGKFGQVFRARFGATPLEYRKSNGRKEIK